MKKQATAWLGEYLHPQEDVPFSLPAAIYFLLKFRPDLANCDCQTVRGRILVYFWWKANGVRDYRDFDWALRETDISYLKQFDAETLIANFPESIAHWLMSREPDVLDSRVLLVSLLQRRYLSLTEFEAFPRFLDVIISSRPDLQETFDCSRFDDQVAALYWWDSIGCHEYPRVSWRGGDVWAELNTYRSHVDFAELHVPHFVTPLLMSREDLPAVMKTEGLGALIDTAKWWDQTGYKEYPYLHWDTAKTWRYFNEMCEVAPQQLPVPRFAKVLISHRADLREAFQANISSGLIAFYGWWNKHGRAEYPRLFWKIWDDLLVDKPSATPGNPSIPKFLANIWAERNDLQSIFRIDTVVGVRGLVMWWEAFGKKEYDFLSSISCVLDEETNSYNAISPPGSFSVGVNVIGFPQGMLGLGEDARAAALAIESMAVPVVVINAPMSGPDKREHIADRLLAEDLQYSISLFCLPPAEMIRLALEGGRHIIESDTYKIGAWPWELPNWPRAFGRADDLVDEIWAQSRYVESAYSSISSKPVFHMPMAVQVPKPVNPDRKRFGLTEGRFLYYLMFDGNSWLSRKNPMAGVHAFQKAFGSDTEPVGLVVKAMNVSAADPTWIAICQLAKKDSRIKIVCEQLDRQDSIDFMASCDAYISLHRAEGFGRVIAEAMLLEQPVIATNFSGNIDFCTQSTSYLVDGELMPLSDGEYLFHDGQYWCDPDLDIAAAQLRRLYEDPSERAHIAAAGREKIENDYTLVAVANAYKERLSSILGREG